MASEAALACPGAYEVKEQNSDTQWARVVLKVFVVPGHALEYHFRDSDIANTGKSSSHWLNQFLQDGLSAWVSS